jgi:regulator of sigma E protease
MILNMIIGIAVLSALVIAHELGHFITAKTMGVRVDEFGLGFPPKLLSIKRGETRYSLNAVPFGGFNKLAGEEDPGEQRGLASKGIGTRLIVLSAGSVMNVLLPLVLFSVAFMVPHDVVIGKVVVEEVAANSPAAMAGIQAGDVIVSVNNRLVRNIYDLHRYIQLNLGNEVTLSIQHQDLPAEAIPLIPRWKPPPGEGAIGVRIIADNPTTISEHYPFWQAVPLGVTECIETFILYKNGIVSMIIGTASAAVVGPVGIVQATGEVAKVGLSPLLEFSALISLILGIVNLFPIPALDGGRIAFVLLEGVRRGRRISPRTEALVHSIGFALLIAVLLLVTYRDILRIIAGESLIP